MQELFKSKSEYTYDFGVNNTITKLLSDGDCLYMFNRDSNYSVYQKIKFLSKNHNINTSKTREYIEKSFEGLTVEVVRRLGRKVREYKTAYRTLIEEQEEGSGGMKALALKKIEGVKDSIKHKRQLDQYKGMGKVLKQAKKARTER